MIAGIDEAGRGPLAGPVVSAAVCFKSKKILSGLKDSKKLTAEKREELFELIQASTYWGIGIASVEEIDQHNILQATLLSMKRAYLSLPIKPILAQVDGNQKPKLDCDVECIIKGDDLIPVISAASILAKVTRDRIMVTLHQKYPEYGFAQHKGYSTVEHIAALDKYGPCIIHRQSFEPIRSRMKTLYETE